MRYIALLLAVLLWPLALSAQEADEDDSGYDRDPLLGLIRGLDIEVETLAIGHLEELPRLLTGGRRDVEEEERHLLAEVNKDLENILHDDVESDHLVRVGDTRHLDLDPLLCDDDLVLGEDLVVADPDGPAGQRAPVGPGVLHDVGVSHHVFPYKNEIKIQ